MHRVTYGVQRLRGRLDHLLESVLERPLAEARPALRAALRLGLYEQLETDAPPYAALSQAVEAARAGAGEGGARLANAVLRKLGRPTERGGAMDRAGAAPEAGAADPGTGWERFPDAERDPVGFLSTWGSHPRWLVERWLRRWSRDDVEGLIEADNRQPGLFLSPSDGDLARLGATLSEHGIESAAVPHGAPCLEVASRTDLAEVLPRVGAFVQDPAAALVAAAVGVAEGDFVLDLCAAPGGKARALRARGARVVAADRSEARVRLLRSGAPLRPPIPLLVADARFPPVRPVPNVFIDAPCTGTGTLARHPDGKWRLEPGTIAELARLQREILDAAAAVVTSGGLVVYATCSLEPEENREQIERFLGRHRDFSLEAPWGMSTDLVDVDGFVEILPQRTGFDGAFAARLRRTE